ncbi:MAG: nicotinate-nicotinamide nucleotide adenylyltransferase [Deltaproteobacteria bacterium]|nr:nicotinate-nicotinamide nucleotide adenylyltransferase [Deltaproteobacteria bacterium]
MFISDLIEPFDPRTREYLHEAVRSLPQEGPPRITIIKQAQGGVRADKRNVLGVLPASFNPPTVAHQALLREADKTVAFDEILLILDQQAMDKEYFGAPLEDRLLMLLVFFGGDPRISLGISNRGLFLDKVEALQHMYPRDTQIYFIVGYDTIVRVLDHRYYEDREEALRSLFSQAGFLVANRGDCGKAELTELFEREENRPFAAQVSTLTLSTDLAGISSSQVRRRLAEGKSIKDLIPPTLEEFLRKRRFYSRQGP